MRKHHTGTRELISQVSHDLRNPLAVAQSNLELALQNCDCEHLAAVATAHERMDEMIDDLLTLAREDEMVGQVVPTSLSAVAEQSWQNVVTADATLVTEDQQPVYADRHRLQQLFENLFRNAVEHGSTSPDSHARHDTVEHSSPSPDSHARQDAVEHGGKGLVVTVGPLADGFYVADTGSGIPEADREQVFDLGYTTTERGTGLGLNIVEQIVEAHDWEITLTQSTGGGARFEIVGCHSPPGHRKVEPPGFDEPG